MQEVMGPLPDRTSLPSLDVEVIETVRLSGIERRRLTYVSEHGDRVPAYLLVPEGLVGKAPAMLCLHQTTAIGKGEPAGLGGKPNLRYGLELAQRGYVTLAPDYPGFGDNGFDPYENGYASGTMKGIWNHMRAVDLLQELPQVDERRIGCIGHSLGGHNTLYVAAFDERLQVMVSSCGFTSFQKYMGGDLTTWSSKAYMPRIADAYGADPARMPFDFSDIVAALAPRALFVSAPIYDDNFEVSGVRDCIEAAMPAYDLLGAGDRLVATYPDAGHDFPVDAREAAYSFIDAALRGK
jgi:dienelactone hydrolase